MRVTNSLSWAAVLITPALCNVKRQSPGEASSILSEVEAYITDIPSLLSAEGQVLATELASIVSEVDPTGVVGDIPSLISSYIPAIETLLDEAISEAIPPGVVPTDVLAEIPAFVSEVVPALATEVDALVTDLPSTLPLSDLPGLVTSYIDVIASDVEVYASELVSVVPSALFPTGTAPASVGTTAPVRVGNGTFPKLPSLTASGPSGKATFTGAGSTWKAEIGLVVGFAAAVAVL
jgi:hypothetical protein